MRAKKSNHVEWEEGKSLKTSDMRTMEDLALNGAYELSDSRENFTICDLTD